MFFVWKHGFTAWARTTREGHERGLTLSFKHQCLKIPERDDFMQIGRFFIEQKVIWGVIEEDGVYPVEDIFENLKPCGKKRPLSGATILPPCVPGKIICVGLNYHDHVREFGSPVPTEPVLFLKPPTAVIGPGSSIIYPETSQQVDYEAELAVVIKKTARKIKPHDAGRYIYGFTCANDVTARDLQRKDGQWTRAKSFDTFLPLGPFIVTGLNPADLGISLFLNGECRQRSSTSNLIFNVEELVSFISMIMTLLPGDVILTGTPSGVGPLTPGDCVEVEIENIGRLINYVVGESE